MIRSRWMLLMLTDFLAFRVPDFLSMDFLRVIYYISILFV